MKTNRILAILLVLVISITVFITPASAEEAHDHGDIEINFLDENLNDENKERITECLLNDECECHEDDIAAYSLICNIAGHNLESNTVLKIKHKRYDTAPRCYQQTVQTKICTRCDYHITTVIDSRKIYCCA